MGSIFSTEPGVASEGHPRVTAPSVFTVREVAIALAVSEWTVYERIRRGEIPVVPVGRARRVPRKWLDDTLADALAKVAS